jgi:hypothetical protein
MSTPSREDLLKGGGLYPIVFPLGWKLVNTRGELEDVPALPGQPFHRVLVQGALMATSGASDSQGELLMVRWFPLDRSIEAALDAYARTVAGQIAKQGIAAHVDEARVVTTKLSTAPCGKVVIHRAGANDDRVQIHYLVLDRTGRAWELTYLLRRENLAQWQPLFAEIDDSRTAPN